MRGLVASAGAPAPADVRPADRASAPASGAPSPGRGAVRAAFLLAGLIVAVLAVEFRPRAEAESPPSLAPQIVTVARGVHLLGETFPNAAYLVETTEGLVLVDTCPEPGAGPVLRQIEELGLDVRRLRAILLTHAHADHSLGARRLREISGAKVHAGRADCEVLRSGSPREAFFSIFAMPQREHATEVDVPLDGGETIEVGDAAFQVLATPGHSPGSVCYLLERDGLRLLFTGDTIMSLTDSEPHAGPGIYSAFLAPHYRGSARDFAASLRKLLDMPVPDLVLPGHPRADPVPQSPRIPRERWVSLLAAAIGKVDELDARLSADGPDFLDGVAKELMPGVHYWGNHGGAALYGLVSPEGRLFLFDAPGGPELPAVLEERWRAAGLGSLRPDAVLLTSCSPESVRGLRAVVSAWGSTVVAPHAALADAGRICPPGTRLVAAEAVAALGWFPVVIVPIRGLDAAAVAYAIRWECRTIVVSGRDPARTTLSNGIAVEPPGPWRGIDPGSYASSIDALRAIAPDLWLPAVPVNGQNANLYGTEWRDVLRTSRALRR